MNFNAMIDHLYKLVDSKGIKNIYTDKPTICFLEKKSFVGKIHQQTQEFQMAVILMASFFINHVSSHHGDIIFWVKRLFCQCRVQKDLKMFCNNLLILFNDSGNAWLAKELLAKELLGPAYLDCIWDEVSHHASGLQQKKRYEARLEERIGSLQRGTRCIEMLSPKKKPFVCSSSCLWHGNTLFWVARRILTFRLSTRKRKGRKNAKRKVLVGKPVLWKLIVCPNSVPINSHWILVLLLAAFCKSLSILLPHRRRGAVPRHNHQWWWQMWTCLCPSWANSSQPHPLR